MNIIDIANIATRNKDVFSVLQQQFSDRGQTTDVQKHQVKIDVKKMLVLQNKLTTTTV